MTTPNTIIEYDDDLVLSGCEFRWLKGDKFALIEAIAICAANDLQYPEWVRGQINTAMTDIFRAVFPNLPLVGRHAGSGIDSLPDGVELSEMREQFKTGTKEASKLLSLKLDRRNIIDTHIKAVRDYHLADLVATLATFKVDPVPMFSDVTETKQALAAKLRRTPVEWEAIHNDDGTIGKINGKTLRTRDVPAICRMASFDKIDDAWDIYKDMFLEDRIAKFEHYQGVNLSK